MITTDKPIWRKITKTRRYDNPGYGKHWAVGGGYVLTLECGHGNRRKQSAGIPVRGVRCKACEHLRRQKKGSIWPAQLIQEVWDESTQMPAKVPWTPSPEEV